jgi:hypothetical protein
MTSGKGKDAEQLKSARPNAELVKIKDMNHVLKLVTSGNTDENIKAYSDPSLPLAPVTGKINRAVYASCQVTMSL